MKPLIRYDKSIVKDLKVACLRPVSSSTNCAPVWPHSFSSTQNAQPQTVFSFLTTPTSKVAFSDVLPSQLKLSSWKCRIPGENHFPPENPSGFHVRRGAKASPAPLRGLLRGQGHPGAAAGFPQGARCLFRLPLEALCLSPVRHKPNISGHLFRCLAESRPSGSNGRERGRETGGKKKHSRHVFFG